MVVALFAAAIPSTEAQKFTPKSDSTFSGEAIFVHTNIKTYLTGEMLYCKLYCLNSDKKTSQISKIAYIELIDSNRKSLLKKKLNLENGLAFGDFFIPTTFKSGNYKLIAYTQWMLNGSRTHFFATDLAIINPFETPGENVSINKSTTLLPIVNSQTAVQKIAAIETDKKTYHNREKVTLRIKNAGTVKGNYSLSVAKNIGVASMQNPENENFDVQKQSFSNNELPELRGELLSGTLISKNGTLDISNKFVALSIPGRAFAFKISKTNPEGKFTFILDKEPLSAAAVIQVLDEHRDDYSIVLDEIKTPELSQLQFQTLVLSPDWQNGIEQKSVANQIQNAYYSTKKDSLLNNENPPAFFHPNEKRYVLDDYTRFPTFRETVTEVLLELYTKKSGGKSSLHVRNPNVENEIYGQSLVLLDGLLIQDTNELYDYNPENVYAVDIISQPYLYGPKTFNGVVNIVTKNFDYETKAKGLFFQKLNLDRPEIKKQYYNPDYSSATALGRIPDYRYQLLWKPEITLENEQTISFYTSDVVGKYEIELQGFTENGQAVTLKNEIDVQ